MKQEMPNILWIGVDEQNIRTIGVYGSKNCSTPFLDRLAGQSLLFDNAFCPTAVCSPSRASMLTGRMPSEGSVIANDLLTWTIPSREASRVRIMKTWADSLRNRHYRTVHVGKWHLTGAEDDKPEDYGFEGTNYGGFGKNWDEPEYHAYRGALGLSPKPELELEIYSKHPVPYEFDPKSARLKGPEEGSLPAFLASRTISYIERLGEGYKTSGEPFFLRCEFWGPHMPCYAPEPYYSLYDPASLELPENFNRLGEGKPEIHQNFIGYWGIATHPIEIQRKYIAAYMAYATCIDRQVGRILDSLEASGLSDDTVVFFTSDHGDMLGAHGLYDKGPFMYEEIYRVPLMVRWPRIVTPGRSSALVYNMDIGATLWDMADSEVPSGGSARSLLPVLKGEKKDTGRELIICEFWHHFDFFPQAMVHSGRDKYVYNFGSVDEYYDLASDPFELHNSVREPENRERIHFLREYLLQWMRKVDSPMKKGLERTLPAKDYSRIGRPD